MSHQSRRSAIALAAIALQAMAVCPADAAPVFSAESAAKLMTEVADIKDVRLSPDGEWVTYSVTRHSVETNSSSTTLLLQRVPRVAGALPPPVELPAIATAIQWCPDGKSLSMLLKKADEPASFVRYDITTGKITPIAIKDRDDTGSPSVRPRISEIPAKYQWSPRGTFIAFAAPLERKADKELDPRRGVAQESSSRHPLVALFILEVANGTVSQLTPDTVRVSTSDAIAWSPDEQALALTVLPQRNVVQRDGDLIVVDRIRRTVRSLVARPGLDAAPVWSPDGRWIAFSTHDGDPRDMWGYPAIIASSGGAITTFSADTLPTTTRTQGWWSADSRAFNWIGNVDMTIRIAQANVRTGSAAVLPLPEGPPHLPYDDNHSISADGQRMAYTRGSLTTPPELFVARLDKSGRSTGAPVQLTVLTPEFPLSPLVSPEAVSWKSQDGKFTVHGLLLRPSEGGSATPPTKPFPTLVYFYGGPSMVKRDFGGTQGISLAMAARGYAVLIPNTRGRGGYGRAFNEAIRTEKTRGAAPLADALSGVDLLIARGLTDPQRLGVLGHSYGGYLTAYAVTATNRFKAAVYYEGSSHLLEGIHIAYEKDTWKDILSRDLFGIHDSYDPAERARLIDESPVLNANRVTTPTLISCGVRSSGGQLARACQPWFEALRRFNVPSAYFLYDEGHVYRKPAAAADNFTRTAEWLDHWVRGLPYPDPTRAGEYGQRAASEKSSASAR